MRKILLTFIMVATLGYSYAKPTKERVKQVTFGIIDQLSQMRGFSGVLQMGVINDNKNEIKKSFQVAFVDYYAKEDMYIAFVSANFMGEEYREIMFFKKYNGRYYLTDGYISTYGAKGAHLALANKVESWRYVPAWFDKLF